MSLAAFSGRRLRELRVRAGKSAEQLAVDVGRSFFTIQGYELGRTDPPSSMVARIADVLDVHPGEFYVEERVA